MAAPAQTTSDARDPSASADPISLAAFVSRRGGRVLAYLDAVTTPGRALTAAGEAFAAFRLARAADPDAEATATTLLRATRRAATAHAENPYRPEGRERPARRTRACDAMPRLLVAWTESRLPDGDVDRLVEHLQDCPDCRALRDAFDRAELGYRAGDAAELDGTEIGVIATAMALAVPPAPEPHPAVADTPLAITPRRRTSIPAPPVPDGDRPARTGRAPVGRRTSIPAPPTGVPASPVVGVDRNADLRDRAAESGRPTALPDRPAAPSRPAREAPAATRATGDAEPDPLGPEALGYAVPRSGLPRPIRRPAAPRVRRRRRRRPPSAAMSAAAPPAAPAEDAVRPADARPSDDRRSDGDPTDQAGEHTAIVLTPPTVASGGVTAVARRALQVPIVRQLGVPAVLLLAVLVAALIAAGVFAGQQQDSVAPITRPTIPTVPANPDQIPPLP